MSTAELKLFLNGKYAAGTNARSADLQTANAPLVTKEHMGLRIGELCGLKWEDVDFQHKILHIRRTVQRISSANGSRKTKIVISTPKSDTSFRDIAIPDVLMKYFEMFRNKADSFILSGKEKPVEPRTMQYRYKKILQSAELENHNFHKLRHTFATNCAAYGKRQMQIRIATLM